MQTPTGGDGGDSEGRRETGLNQAYQAAGGGTKRPLARTLPARMGPIWRTVTVIGKEYEVSE